jgi:ATP-binding cassette subfamily B protein
MDCGPTCLRMVAKYYGKHFNLEGLRKMSGFSREGVSLLGISEAAENLGFRTKGAKLSFKTLITEAPLPCILHWTQDHFVILTPQSNKKRLVIADPAKGIVILTKKEFCDRWISTKNSDEDLGIALLLTPTFEFYKLENEKTNIVSWKILTGFLKKYKQYFFQIFLALFFASMIQLIFPFLTQSIVDTGIKTKNLQFITVILIAQLMLFFGRTVIEFIRSRLLLHISTRINITILSDFWIKLMRLPISYFDTKRSGDILQRIGDHHRIENFITQSSLSTIFSIINLVIFSIVLLLYNPTIFLVFLLGSILYFLWIRFFMRFRRKLDYKRFAIASKENSITMQLIYGMQEIKLNNAEHQQRWEWENIQTSLFKLSFKNLSLSQYQEAGAFLINEGKNIIITFLVARLVIMDQLTLGAMLAIQYIIGQLNSPVEQLISFMQSALDAKISLERLNEIHQIEDEEREEMDLIYSLPKSKNIKIKNLTFSYPGAGNEPVLKNINLAIAEGKVTAIVGMSGSGKTTLLKLLLRFYEDYFGEITVGEDPISIREEGKEKNLKKISPRFWRSQCGSVMQDGYIFNDTIAKNIAAFEVTPDYQKLTHACKVANIMQFVEELPLGFNTKIGSEASGISEGQKQRILIARAVYKNPEYLFFDEATNSLDANNERLILENLAEFFEGKTVIVVAHRLSTVKNADTIIVLHEGKIIENGAHEDLILKKGEYFQLVKNQLELGN